MKNNKHVIRWLGMLVSALKYLVRIDMFAGNSNE
jgi:hypothetical protein